VVAAPLRGQRRNEQFFVRGESDCTSESGAGQFSIFGALEDKDGVELYMRATLKGLAKEQRFFR
jgi:hypothetical protein